MPTVVPIITFRFDPTHRGALPARRTTPLNADFLELRSGAGAVVPVTGSRRGGSTRAQAAPIDLHESAQRIADVIAAALHTVVEVVDRDLVRLATSGTSTEPPSMPQTLYIACMRTRLPAWADAAGANRPCPLVACPILAAGHPVAAIGLLTVLAGQADSLRAHQQEVTDLVTALSEPLSGGAGWRTTPPPAGRAEPMEAVLESVPDGLLAVDPEGVVLYCNRAALAMLRAEMDLTGQLLTHWYAPAESVRDPTGARSREVVFERHGHRFEFVETTGPLRVGTRLAGTFIVLRAACAGGSQIWPSLPTLIDAERRLIEEALGRHGTSGAGKRRAARALGISLSTLYRKLHRHQSRPRRR